MHPLIFFFLFLSFLVSEKLESIKRFYYSALYAFTLVDLYHKRVGITRSFFWVIEKKNINKKNITRNIFGEEHFCSNHHVSYVMADVLSPQTFLYLYFFILIFKSDIFPTHLFKLILSHKWKRIYLYMLPTRTNKYCCNSNTKCFSKCEIIFVLQKNISTN